MGWRLFFPVPVLIFCFAACGDRPGPPELEQAVQVVRYLSAKKQLDRSSFTVVFPEGKPSDFVNWMFSSFGAAEWPDSESMAEQDPLIREQAASINAPLLPKDVALLPLKPDPNQGKQVVVKFDDNRGVIIVEGYLDPKEGPVLVREWKIPEIKKQAFEMKKYSTKRAAPAFKV